MAKRKMNQVDQSFYVRPPGVKDRTSAGGLVVRRDEHGQILIALIHEADADGWFLPKGGVEEGESLEETARREIQEEAGFARLTRLAALGTRARLGWRRQIWITTHYFLFVTEEIDGVPTDPKHRYAAQWFSLHALPPMFWPDQKELVELSRPLIKQALESALQAAADTDTTP